MANYKTSLRKSADGTNTIRRLAVMHEVSQWWWRAPWDPAIHWYDIYFGGSAPRTEVGCADAISWL